MMRNDLFAREPFVLDSRKPVYWKLDFSDVQENGEVEVAREKYRVYDVK